MIFLNSKPKSNEIDFIEGIIQMLNTCYSVFPRKMDFLIVKEEIKNYSSLKDEIIKIIISLDLKINIDYLDLEENEIEYLFNLPRTFIFEKSDNETTLKITKFGVEHAQITMVEAILFLSAERFMKDGFGVPDEVFDDVELSYRPFLVILSIYYGFGNQIIARNWITGSYFSIEDDDMMNYKYFVPLDINSTIYCYSIIIYCQKNLYEKKYPDFNSYSIEINNEIKKCLKYLNNNKSLFVNKVIEESNE